jgi:protein SCO1/2
VGAGVYALPGQVVKGALARLWGVIEHPSTAVERTSTARRILRNPYVWAFVIGIVVLTAIRPLLRHEPDPPGVLWRLPTFRLTAEDDTPFGSDDLKGRVWVANLFFTRCSSICPHLTRAMSALQRRYDEAGVDSVRLLSITVDPEHDSPEVLRAYAREHGIDTKRWRLLTGAPGPIRTLVEGGLRAAMGQAPPPGGDLFDIAHAGHLFLVDGDGGVRGFYATDAAGLDEVFHRSRHVLDEQRR